MTAGRGVYVFCQWLLLVIIARLADPGALGQFTYALALTGPIIVFAQLNMRAYMSTDTKSEFAFKDYRGARLVGVTLALALIVAVALFKQDTGLALSVVVLVGLYKAFESLSDVHFGAMQKREVFRDIAVSVALHGVLAVLALGVVLWWTGDLAKAVAAVAVIWLILLLAFDIPNATRVMRAQPDPESAASGSVWQAMVACFPFGITVALMSLRINVPVYFIEAQLGVEQVGYYSAVAYFIVAGRLVTGSLVQTTAPRIARFYNGGEMASLRTLLFKVLGIMVGLGVAGVLVAWVLGALVLRIAYGEAYESFASLLVLVMCAAAVGYFAQLSGMCLTVARYRRMLIVSNVLGTASVALAAWYLVPMRGLEGGALALMAGTLVIVVINALTFAHALSTQKNRMNPKT